MPEFKGARLFLNIPADVAHDPRFKSDKSILLFGEIYSMLNVTGEFYMSNKEIAKRIRVKSTKTVKNCLNELEKLGYIKRKVIRDSETNEVIGRKISLPEVSGYPNLGYSTTRGGGNQLPEPRAADYPLIEHDNRTTNKTINNSLSQDTESNIDNPDPFAEKYSKEEREELNNKLLNYFISLGSKLGIEVSGVQEKQILSKISKIRYEDAEYAVKYVLGRMTDDVPPQNPVAYLLKCLSDS